MKHINRKHKLITGAFVSGMIALAVGTVFLLGDGASLFRGQSRYFAVFKNTAGLGVGAPVKMGGVEIGSVEQIGIDQEGTEPRIRLTLAIRSPHERLIKADSLVSQETQGMLGDLMLNVSSGTPSSPVLAPLGTLGTKERLDVSALVDQSTGIIRNVNQTTEKLDAFMGSLPDAETMKGVANDFRASTRELSAMLALLNSKDGALRSLAEPVNAARIKRTLESLESAADKFESVAAKIDGGKGTLGALVNDAALYDDMRQLLGRANRSKAAKFVIRQVLDDDAAP